ncbi:cell morphogenesis N-terminal-domain-containing protein [Apiospora hydei]|uniref:Cell morphogenesis N-terminal-domain-containing protein n=1 Tax=Apiospora hydei TaxID=1337664 RepID=A0ABR1WEG2_9PEZI
MPLLTSSSVFVAPSQALAELSQDPLRHSPRSTSRLNVLDEDDSWENTVRPLPLSLEPPASRSASHSRESSFDKSQSIGLAGIPESPPPLEGDSIWAPPADFHRSWVPTLEEWEFGQHVLESIEPTDDCCRRRWVIERKNGTAWDDSNGGGCDHGFPTANSLVRLNRELQHASHVREDPIHDRKQFGDTYAEEGRAHP